MDKFLETYILLRLNYEETENVNSPTTSKQIERVIRNLAIKIKVRDWMVSLSNSTKHSKIYYLFQKTEEEWKIPNTFYEASITLIPKPDKDTTKKENCRPVSLMNIDAKIPNKILADKIQQYIKRIIHHDQVRFIPGIPSKDGSVSANQSHMPR